MCGFYLWCILQGRFLSIGQFHQPTCFSSEAGNPSNEAYVSQSRYCTCLSLYLRVIEFNILNRWWNCRWVSSVGTRRRGGRARGGRGGGGRSRWGERTRCWTSRWRRRTKVSPTSPGNDRTPKDKASDFRHCSNLKSWPQENIGNVSEMKFSVLDIGFTSKRALSRHLTFPRIQNTSMSFGRMLKTDVLAALREFPCFSPPWTVAKARDLRQSDI